MSPARAAPAPAGVPGFLGRAWGRGTPTFVLLHGLGVGSRMVAPLGRRLARSGTVLAPDLPGFGAAAHQRPPGLEQQAALVADRFREAASTVVLVGCSVGSQVAVRAAAELGHDLRALVLASPTVDRHRRTWPSQLSRWAVELAQQPSLLRRTQFEDHAAAGRLRVLRTFREALEDRPEQVLPHVHAPTLVLRGTRDPLVGDRWAREVATALPNGALRVVPARHPMTFTEPAVCEAAILTFLARTERVREGLATLAPGPAG